MQIFWDIKLPDVWFGSQTIFSEKLNHASSMEDDMEISPKKVFGAVLMCTGGI